MELKVFKRNASCLAALAFAQGATSAGASDLNPLGFYFGGAVGQSDVRANEDAGFGAPQGTPGVPLGFDERHAGWKLAVGMRPISPLGVELAYVDFGHPAALGNFDGNSTGLRTPINAHPKALELSGLAYLPLRRWFVSLIWAVVRQPGPLDPSHSTKPVRGLHTVRECR